VQFCVALDRMRDLNPKEQKKNSRGDAKGRVLRYSCGSKRGGDNQRTVNVTRTHLKKKRDFLERIGLEKRTWGGGTSLGL